MLGMLVRVRELCWVRMGNLKVAEVGEGDDPPSAFSM